MDRRSFLAGLAVLFAADCSPRTNTLTVGSKNFTEQLILGELLAQLLGRVCSQPVERRLKLTRGCLAVLAEFRNPRQRLRQKVGRRGCEVSRATHFSRPGIEGSRRDSGSPNGRTGASVSFSEDTRRKPC